MFDPFVDLRAWCKEHDLDLDRDAFTQLEALLTKYHEAPPPNPTTFPVVEMGAAFDWSRFEQSKTG